MAAVPYYNWTGFYIGGHIGWSSTEKDWSNYHDGFGVADPLFLGTSHKGDSFIGGGQIGINWQAGQWVFGIEGDISAVDHDQRSSCGPLLAYSCNSQADWYATATGRIGYAWDRALLYVKGGAAFAEDSYNVYDTSTGLLFGNADDTRTGWTVGVGLEYAFWNNWSAKIEYNYLDFGSDRHNFHDAGLLVASGDIDQQVHMVKFGINYRFGAPAVSARY